MKNKPHIYKDRSKNKWLFKSVEGNGPNIDLYMNIRALRFCRHMNSAKAKGRVVRYFD